MNLLPIKGVVLLCALTLGTGVCLAENAETLCFEGLIEPFEIVNVGSPVEGVVERVNVKRSALVLKGEPLVQLESSAENTVIKRAKVLAAVDGEIKFQEERLAFAKRMQSRVEELFQAQSISTEKRDEAATEVTLATAQLQKSKERRTLARLELERAKTMLDRRTIKSPITGIVVEHFVSPGEFVDSKPLLRLAQMDPLRVDVVLPASMLLEIRPGMEAKILLESQEDRDYGAIVKNVDQVIDPASNTFGVRLELPNPDYHLPCGLKCHVRFVDLQDNVLPTGVFTEDQEKLAVNLP